MADDKENTKLLLRLIICLIAAASGALVIAVYHCITASNMRRRSLQNPETPQHLQQEMSMENSVAELLPAHKYKKGVGLIDLDDGTCAICLCEFEDGEELRTLPECVHSFHVACIDMWFYSHLNCPMCRTSVGDLVLPSPTLRHLLHPSTNHITTPTDVL